VFSLRLSYQLLGIVPKPLRLFYRAACGLASRGAEAAGRTTHAAAGLVTVARKGPNQNQ